MQNLNRQFPANSGQNIAVVGRYIWLKSATGQVQIKTDRGETSVLSAGDWIKTDNRFTEFFAQDLSGAQNDVTFVISETGEAGKYGFVEISAPATFEATADKAILATTATLILAANSNRSEAIITADSANAAVARVGGSTVAAAVGSPLVAGATLILQTTAAVYAYSTSAATFQLSETGF